MEKIEFFHQENEQWTVLGSGPQQAERRLRHKGLGTGPEMNELRIGPNCQTDIHAHATGEIMYVVAGQLILGQHTLKPGDSMAIPGLMLYSFRAGPEGACYLVCRPRSDRTFFTKQQFMELQSLDSEARPEYISRNAIEFEAKAKANAD